MPKTLKQQSLLDQVLEDVDRFAGASGRAKLQSFLEKLVPDDARMRADLLKAALVTLKLRSFAPKKKPK